MIKEACTLSCYKESRGYRGERISNSRDDWDGRMREVSNGETELKFWLPHPESVQSFVSDYMRNTFLYFFWAFWKRVSYCSLSNRMLEFSTPSFKKAHHLYLMTFAVIQAVITWLSYFLFSLPPLIAPQNVYLFSYWRKTVDQCLLSNIPNC